MQFCFRNAIMGFFVFVFNVMCMLSFDVYMTALLHFCAPNINIACGFNQDFLQCIHRIERCIKAFGRFFQASPTDMTRSYRQRRAYCHHALKTRFSPLQCSVHHRQMSSSDRPNKGEAATVTSDKQGVYWRQAYCRISHSHLTGVYSTLAAVSTESVRPAPYIMTPCSNSLQHTADDCYETAKFAPEFLQVVITRYAVVSLILFYY